ncbi:hypothetical protein FPSE_11058 [Fusarium pseudograminearum CS3096]|uniref:Uncharacterized protein n=1 Tax=Fusarium pseudograminearum (strain CS3096) TaxID=1028729 RepID=K3V9R1_FUSPC|nr:hypothetical protein FPSE_11058 [Fusarium pseudograminearum CS3096]EKJ68753.1 hypothetical protein FPSE_11058 [Fusarium pseudograminearum CS3096]
MEALRLYLTFLSGAKEQDPTYSQPSPAGELNGISDDNNHQGITTPSQQLQQPDMTTYNFSAPKRSIYPAKQFDAASHNDCDPLRLGAKVRIEILGSKYILCKRKNQIKQQEPARIACEPANTATNQSDFQYHTCLANAIDHLPARLRNCVWALTDNTLCIH